MTDHNTSGPKSPHPAPPEQQWGTPLNMHRTAIMREVFAIRAALFGLDMRFGSNQDMNELATELNWLIANDNEWFREQIKFFLPPVKPAHPDYRTAWYMRRVGNPATIPIKHKDT